MNTCFEPLRQLLAQDYKLAPDALTLDAPLAALGIDSLGVAELLFNIEDRFQITLPAQPVALDTLGDVVRYIDALVLAQHAGAAPAGQLPAMPQTGPQAMPQTGPQTA